MNDKQTNQTLFVTNRGYDDSSTVVTTDPMAKDNEQFVSQLPITSRDLLLFAQQIAKGMVSSIIFL